MKKLSQLKNKERYPVIREEYGTDETHHWSNVNDKKNLHTGNSNQGLSENSWTNVDTNKKDHQENLSNPNNPGVNTSNSWSRTQNSTYAVEGGFDSLDSWSDVNDNKKYHHDAVSNTYNPGLVTNSWDNIDTNKKNQGSYRYVPKTVVESVNLVTGEKNIEVVPTGNVDYKND